MTTLSLVENAYLANTLGTPLGGLFHSAPFFQLHAGEEGRFFEWTDGQRVLASVHYTPTDDGLWRSPAQGTFAGYASHQELTLAELLNFHEAVEYRLVQLGARRLEVLPPPMAHGTAAFSEQLYALRSRGFEMTRCDLNQSQTVRPGPMAMSRGNRRCLEKCRNEGYVSEQLAPEALAEAYLTIATNREAKGYGMSMSEAQLRQMLDSFPDKVVLFGCRHRGELAAAAICLLLDSSILYVAFWGDLPAHANRSPIVVLASSIHAFCLERGISTFDVGTSTIDMEPNMGLLRFKSGLGFETSLKVRLEKQC